MSCGPQATLSEATDSRSRLHIEIQYGRVFSFAFAMESIAIASHRLGWDGMEWDGMVDGPIKRLLSPPRGRRPRAEWPI